MELPDRIHRTDLNRISNGDYTGNFAINCDQHSGFALLLQRLQLLAQLSVCNSPLAKQVTRADQQRMPLNRRLQALPGQRGEVLWHCSQRYFTYFRPLHNRGGKRMLGTLFSLGYQAQDFISLPAGDGDDIRKFGLAPGNRSGLVEQYGPNGLDALKALATFDQYALFRALAGANDDRSRRCQP